jgi:hypothetical protein
LISRSGLRKGFTYRSLAVVAIAASAMVLFPKKGRSEQQQGTPADVTTAPATEATSGGGELGKVTVTGYIIPRIGDGPQPVETLTQDFIRKQADQNLNDVLARYPGGLSFQNTLTSPGNSTSPGSSFYGLRGW